MKRTLLALALTLALARSAQAQSLTLLQAAQRALQTHPAVQLAEANVARAQSGVRDARAARLPSLSVDGGITRFQEPMVVAPLHGFDPRNPPKFDRTLSQGNLSAAYTLFDAGRGARVERAEALEQAAQSGQRAAEMQLLADVSRAYLRVKTTRDVAAAHERRLAALTQERGRAQQLVDAGRAARVVLMRAQAALSAATADRISAASDVEVAENELARLLDIAPDSLRATQLTSPLTQSSAAEPADALRARAHEQNPDLQRARRQIAAAEATRGEARGLWLPRVQVAGRYIEYASTASTPQGEWQGGAQLSYPIFTGGTRSAANDRASAEVRAAAAEYALAVRRLDDAVDRGYAALSAAHARATALASAVAQSEEVSRIEKLALDTGAGVQTDYLNAEADLFRARAGLSEAVAAEMVARIELARVSGDLTEDWIARNLEQH